MPPPDFSLIIVSFQVRDLLERCLASLARVSTPPVCEIIVVDNASSDNSAAMVREKFPQVTLIENAKNVGFAAANNQGLTLATGRYWMLLNPDTEIPADAPNPLAQLVAFMDNHPRAGACGASLFYPDGTRQHSAFHFPSLAQIYIDLFPVNWRLRESSLNGRYPFSRYERGEPFPIDHPLGAALLVRPQAAEQVGLLDEAYFIYAEEVDWCMRLKRAGWEIWCVPSAHIIHHQARSTRQFREMMFVELWKARLRLFHKNYSRAFNVAARALIRRGMARAIREVSAADDTQDDRAQKLAAYQAVMRMAQ